jgi:large subunit ribosomal protein L5
MSLNLKQKYLEKINKAMMEKYGYKSVMEIPYIEKIVINSGVGDSTKDYKLLESALNEITLISGQKPLVTKAKKSIATYKLREGQAIGIKVTLRGEKMYNFIENLVNVAIPRVRDFKGISPNAFDGRGNYTLGVKEQIIFTEVHFDQIKRIRGFDITFVTSTNDDKQAFEMLKIIGLPFMVKK